MKPRQVAGYVLVAAIVVGAVGIVMQFRIQSVLRQQPSTAGPHSGSGTLASGQLEPNPEDLQRLFDDYGMCLRNGGAGGDRYWDVDRFAREIDRNGVMTASGYGPNSPERLRTLRADLVSLAKSQAGDLVYDETEIRKVDWLIASREAVIETRHINTKGSAPIRHRKLWWVVWNNGWRFYDHQSVGWSIRYTADVEDYVAARNARGGVDDPVEAKAEAALANAEKAYRDGDLETAEKRFAHPAVDQVYRRDRVLVTRWRARIALSLGKFDEAKKLLDIAELEDSNTAYVFFMQAECYYRLRQYERSVAAADRYIRMVGPDAAICMYRGHALMALDRKAMAATAYRQVLDDDRDDEMALYQLAKCVGPSGLPELESRFRAFKDPAAALPDLAAHVYDSPEILAMYVKVVREKSPDDPEALFHASRLKVAKDPKAAVEMVLQVAKRSDRDWNRYFPRFAHEAVVKGKTIEVYRSLSDANSDRGFRSLADELRDERDLEDEAVGKQFEALLTAHRARRPMDVWLAYYDGELAHARKKYDEAERHFSDAMSRPPDEQARETFRWVRVDNLATAGRALQAYMTVGPARATFSQLAGRMDDLPSLAGLIWLHQFADPAVPALSLWRGTLAFRRKAYGVAVPELTRFLQSAEDGYDWQARDHLVRSLLRLKRYKEAREVLRPKDDKRYYNRVLAAAITAATGDVAATERELDELAKNSWAAATFHADTDLSEILRTEPFRKLIEKYPPPKKDAPGDPKK
jgi:tetratricopeptide (TPR) repeat protein